MYGAVRVDNPPGAANNRRGMARDEILQDVLRGLLIAGAVVLLVLFAPSGEHAFIYLGF